MRQLNEGLQANDLDFLIMPLISIDEYESKIDDRKAIVVGIYVTDSDPAQELSSFLEKGTVPVLDTEVSPAPTEDGYYIVFIEMDRDEKFVDNLLALVDSMTNLTNVDDWEFSPYQSKEDENYPLTKKELEQHVNTNPESVEVREPDEEDDDTADQPDVTAADDKQETTEQVASFMKNAMVESFSIDDNIMVLTSAGQQQSFKIVEFVVGEIPMPLVMPGIGNHQLMESTRLQNMLGYAYVVCMTEGHLLVADDDSYLLLKAVD